MLPIVWVLGLCAYYEDTAGMVSLACFGDKRGVHGTSAA
jgi:hypothetical protein